MKVAEPAVIAAAAPQRDTPFNHVMDVWARWMRLKDRQHSDGEGNPTDTKEFMQLGEAVNTMVDDLPRLMWWAVYRSKGICTVWRFPDRSLADAMLEAEEKLTPKFMAHIATRRYFD